MCVSPAHPLSDADRTALLAGVEGLVVTIVSEWCKRKADREDLAQECRLTLWKLSAEFDPARTPASKWAAAIIRNVCRYRQADEGRRYDGAKEVALTAADQFGRELADPRDLAADLDRDPVDDALEEFARSATAWAAADTLAALTPKQRRLAELAIVDRLTAAEIADRLGQPLKVVRRNLQVVIAALTANGKVTAEVMAAAGVTAEELRHCRFPRSACRADMKARRELVAEAGEAVPAKELAELLGVTEGTVQSDRRAVKAAMGHDSEADLVTPPATTQHDGDCASGNTTHA